MQKLGEAVAAAAVAVTVAVLGAGLAAADGTETLGPPTVDVGAGTGMAIGGVGLGGRDQVYGGGGASNSDATFEVSVPAAATVDQVLLYWEGHGFYPVDGDPGPANGTDPGPDNTLTVNGTSVTGTAIGGPTFFFPWWQDGALLGNVYSVAFRADVTDLALIGPGANRVTVGGMDNSFANNGAGVVVIYDDGGTHAAIGLRDGLDLAAGEDPWRYPAPLDTTVPQTFSFTAEPVSRMADLGLMVGSVGTNRPNAIKITAGGVTTTLDTPLVSGQGPEWDAVTVPFEIPAGATSVTVQVLSQRAEDGTTWPEPASLAWVMSSLSVPTTPAPTTTTTVPTAGPGAGTPGYWRNHPEEWPVTSLTIGGKSYTRTTLLGFINDSTSSDMTYVIAAQLVATKLNLLSGTDPSCISSTVSDADTWLSRNKIGSRVGASSAAWKAAEPLKNQLDAYNNGALCAPPRS